MVAAGALWLAGCPRPTPPPVAPDVPPPPQIPLERVCQDTFPLGERTVGALFRLLAEIAPRYRVTERACKSGDEWTIGYATGEGAGDKPPIGFEVLHMEGDALLTFEARDRDAPTINLCRVLDVTLDERHRVRAVALWESSDEAAFDAARPERSTATLAWVELLSQTPSACALGKREQPGHIGEVDLDRRMRCGRIPFVVLDRPAECDDATPTPVPPPLAPGAIFQAVAANHRFAAGARIRPPSDFQLRLHDAERCVYEPPPAEHDICVAEYEDGGGVHWYGRGDVTRTGANGAKNYVDSYLTFKLLKRLEAERKADQKPAPLPPPKK